MESYAIAVGKQALFLVLILAAPPVLTAMVVGLFVSLIQATTQIQEQTLTFVPKMVGVVIVLALFGPLGMAELVTFTKTLLETFPDFIR
ncbi:MAG: flagellar biosynthesis protein FliQ [Deltaproteobacteria bacterium]|nr:flagellar biosynthesis protein FliQ [Deltaproteobacteria bacterium]